MVEREAALTRSVTASTSLRFHHVRRCENGIFFERTGWVSIILINLNFTTQSDNQRVCVLSSPTPKKKTPPESAETASVRNRRGCAGKTRRPRGRSLIANLLERRQQRRNAATHGPPLLGDARASYARQSIVVVPK